MVHGRKGGVGEQEKNLDTVKTTKTFLGEKKCAFFSSVEIGLYAKKNAAEKLGKSGGSHGGKKSFGFGQGMGGGGRTVLVFLLDRLPTI